jgi:rhamnopyranosyl-N-acetylglucosaminyl-diphospho-decaprenol beta-1,3/1,4-galactofuranosyltransferase
MTLEETRRARSGSPVPDGVTAVVLTHMRPRLASAVTRSLLETEGLPADRVIVVVNGTGGLDDPALERRIRMVRLSRNTGPAGGFRAGLTAAFEDPATRWAYLCEDDVGLFELPAPRVADLLRQIDDLGSDHPPVGAVVAYGRRFVGRGSHTVNVVPSAGSPIGRNAVDVACWGATLISRSVVDAGVLPDPSWFFGLEDVDFFCQVREAGFAVLLDEAAARKVAVHQTGDGRDEAIRDHRPTDRDEAWRSYYHSRNSFAVARRHGRPSWHAWHLAFALRQLQKAHGSAQRAAILHGLWDGALGRMGENARYGRKLGEFDSQPSRDGSPSPS